MLISSKPFYSSDIKEHYIFVDVMEEEMTIRT